MRGFVLAVAAVGGVFAVACGGGAQMMIDTPVKQQPLTGKINGTTFTAVSATASAMKAFSDGGERWIDVYDSQVDCSNFFPSASREILGTVPWQVTSYDFSLSHNLTLEYTDDAGQDQNDIATTGRAEIISAPPPDGGLATIRIRADFNVDNTVEGEIQVQVCD